MSVAEIVGIATVIVGALAAAIVALWKERITKRDLAEKDAVIEQKEKDIRAFQDEVNRQYRERNAIAERRNADAEVMAVAWEAVKEARRVVEANTHTLGRLERERDRKKP